VIFVTHSCYSECIATVYDAHVVLMRLGCGWGRGGGGGGGGDRKPFVKI
jgi:hypothetical protein